MTHTLAMEWAEHGIRVNSISPGFVKTALTYYVEKSPDWDTKMKYYGGMPRLALPQELGWAFPTLGDGWEASTNCDAGVPMFICFRIRLRIPLVLISLLLELLVLGRLGRFRFRNGVLKTDSAVTTFLYSWPDSLYMKRLRENLWLLRLLKK